MAINVNAQPAKLNVFLQLQSKRLLAATDTRHLMQRLLILLAIAFFSCSSGRQTSILGEWKPVKVTVYNVFSKTTLVWYDKNNIESVKERLIKRYILEWQVNSKNLEEDTTAFNSELDKKISNRTP